MLITAPSSPNARSQSPPLCASADATANSPKKPASGGTPARERKTRAIPPAPPRRPTARGRAPPAPPERGGGGNRPKNPPGGGPAAGERKAGGVPPRARGAQKPHAGGGDPPPTSPRHPRGARRGRDRKRAQQ